MVEQLSFPQGPYSSPIELFRADKNFTAYTLYKVNESLAGDTPFTDRPTFRSISNLFTRFAERILYELTDCPHNHAHLVFNYRHQLLLDIKDIERQQYKKNTFPIKSPFQDDHVPIQDLLVHPTASPDNAPTQNNTQVTASDAPQTPFTTDTSPLSLAVLSAGPIGSPAVAPGATKDLGKV